eukprot:scaffold7567_cov104-Isochrysis_galbana.AAC.6
MFEPLPEPRPALPEPRPRPVSRTKNELKSSLTGVHLPLLRMPCGTHAERLPLVASQINRLWRRTNFDRMATLDLSLRHLSSVFDQKTEYYVVKVKKERGPPSPRSIEMY